MPPFKLKRTEAEGGSDLNESLHKGPALKRVVFIDSTWSQTNQITSDERLRGKAMCLGTFLDRFPLQKLLICSSLKRKGTLNVHIGSIPLPPFCIMCVYESMYKMGAVGFAQLHSKYYCSS